MHRRDGTDAWVQLRLTLHHEDGDVVLVDGIIRDATERKRTEAALLRQALHDPLTGLPNRALFYDRLQHALSRADRIRAAVTQPIDLAGTTVDLGLSVGVARAEPANTADPDQLLRSADEAMYLDKAAGRDGTRPKPT